MKWIVYHFNPKVTKLEACKICSIKYQNYLQSELSTLTAIVRIQEGEFPVFIDAQYDVKAVKWYAKDSNCIYLKAIFKP